MSRSAETSRDLLFAIVALEQGAIDKDQLVAAFRTWTGDGKDSLRRILVKQCGLARGVSARLSRIVDGRFGNGRQNADEPAPDPHATITHVPGHATSSHAPSSGGRFQTLRPHARGGLGEVFLALDPELNRTVALKELLARRAHDPGSQARFLLEAVLTGRLEHPGIVPVYGLGRYEDGRPYYAMRFIQGETLRAAIERFHGANEDRSDTAERALTFVRLLRSVIDACNAVAYAHSRGVVHRDVKPENIMLGPFGETLVVDWGIAKLMDQPESNPADWPTLKGREAEASLTMPGSVVGTPRYMSPEQAAGALERVGPASDLYSLGATLYHLLVGHSPFPGDDASEVLRRVRAGIFPAPRRLRRTVDPALESICLRAMALRPEERHASALELARELEAWLADVRYRGDQERALSQMKGSLARLCLERAYGLLGREKQDEGMLWLARALEHAPEELERAVRAGLYGWYHGPKLLERSLRHTGAIHALSFCPEARRLATASADRTARLWDVATGTPLCKGMSHDAPVRFAAFHPGGAIVITADDSGTIRSWDAVTGALAQTLLELDQPVERLELSSDGSRLAAVAERCGSFLWDTAKARAVATLPRNGARLLTLTFSPDAKVVATSAEDGTVLLWNTTTGRKRGAPLPHDAAAPALAFAPDGRTLLTGSIDGKARLWTLTGRRSDLEFDHRGPISCVAFAPGGNTIATASDDGTGRLWDAATGRPIGEPLVHTERVACLAFSPDGSTLATGSRDGTVRFWDTHNALPIGPPLPHRGPVGTLAFSLDGRRLATGSSDGLARCWTVPVAVDGTAERIMCWVRITTDLEFDEGDAIRRMDGATSWSLRRLLVELGGPPVR